MKFKVLSVLALVIWSSGLFSQTKKSTQKTEILTYDSAVYDPTSEETQVVFKNSANQKKIFYYSKQDELKLEEQFLLDILWVDMLLWLSPNYIQIS